MAPVCVLVMPTSAWEMTEPDWSCTMPTTLPPPTCATTKHGLKRQKNEGEEKPNSLGRHAPPWREIVTQIHTVVGLAACLIEKHSIDLDIPAAGLNTWRRLKHGKRLRVLPERSIHDFFAGEIRIEGPTFGLNNRTQLLLPSSR